MLRVVPSIKFGLKLIDSTFHVQPVRCVCDKSGRKLRENASEIKGKCQHFEPSNCGEIKTKGKRL